MAGLVRRWLVGLSYRVVYRRDPVPSHKSRRLNLLNDALIPVHGEIYIDDVELTPGKQPGHSMKDADDHSFMRYAEVLPMSFSLTQPSGQVVQSTSASGCMLSCMNHV